MSEHKIRFSHSSLKDYEGCARRYHEVKVLRKYPFQETDATRYGTEVHAAIENYIKDGTPIPDMYSQFQPVVDAVLRKPGRRHPEGRTRLRTRPRLSCAHSGILARPAPEPPCPPPSPTCSPPRSPPAPP